MLPTRLRECLEGSGERDTEGSEGRRGEREERERRERGEREEQRVEWRRMSDRIYRKLITTN